MLHTIIDLTFKVILFWWDKEIFYRFLFHSCIYWQLVILGSSVDCGAELKIFSWSQVSLNTFGVQWFKIVQLLFHVRRSECKPTYCNWNSWLESRACLHQTLYILYNHNSFHFGKVTKYVLDYAISNTRIKLLSVEIPENIKMPKVITKAIEDYRQCALSKDTFVIFG